MQMYHISRRDLLFCLLPVFLLLSMIVSYKVVTANPLLGKIILIDAGHGGIDSGANRPGILEKDINLAVAIQLKEILNQQGAKVILTREADTELSGQCDNERVHGRYRRDLAARIEMVQESDADLFISLHANANPNPNRYGAEAFYFHQSESSKALASAIQTELLLITAAASKSAPGNYYVLRCNKVPATLIELGYITNPAERQLLEAPDHQHKIAEAIAKGIARYYQP